MREPNQKDIFITSLPTLRWRARRHSVSSIYHMAKTRADVDSSRGWHYRDVLETVLAEHLSNVLNGKPSSEPS